MCKQDQSDIEYDKLVDWIREELPVEGDSDESVNYPLTKAEEKALLLEYEEALFGAKGLELDDRNYTLELMDGYIEVDYTYALEGVWR